MKLTPLAGFLLALPVVAQADDNSRLFQLADVFGLEFASDPQISPDGAHIVYVRNFMDIMKDRRRSNLWIVKPDGKDHRPLTTGNRSDSQPRFSPDGKRLAFVSSGDGSAQIWMCWLDTGQTAKLTNLTRGPSGLAWSPDGKWIAFSMFVMERPEPFVKLPAKPKGAEWAKPAKYIDRLQYRSDGAGYLEDGYRQIFVLSADGGTPRQLTHGPFQHSGRLSWTPDGKSLVFSANRHENRDYDPLNREIYEVQLQDGKVRALTRRQGPDQSPVVSPQGDKIAYLGFDDRLQGYQLTQLWVMDRDGSNPRLVTKDFDRSVQNPVWDANGSSLVVQCDDRGETHIARVLLDGTVRPLVGSVGGMSLGRPYSSGSFSMSRTGRIAYTHCTAQRPADVAVLGGGKPRQLTSLNEDLLGHKELGAVEEVWFESSFDKRKVQGWVVLPPHFDATKKYPLVLEIHGGPFANYGPRFAAEIQLYAAAGYVVLYLNPRGSTSYGQEFGNLIHHNYPGQDYDDLMSGVDHVIARDYIDKDRLYVTGGSGGGVLSSWIVGKTNCFRAAVVQKPVINWYSFVLTADAAAFFYKYWFPAFPWDDPDDYLKRSPLSLVGHVKTPTMLITGEVDYRTPISESEQYYQALKLRQIDTALVRIPGASHGIARRPSQLMTKVAHVLKWFERHR